MLKIATLPVVLIAAVALGLGYLGLLPGVSSVFGSDKPRDLGIRVGEADLASGRAKSGMSFVELPPTTSPVGSIRHSGQVAVSQTFTDRELTALARASRWIYNPFQDVQIKIGNDGSMEASGILRVDRLNGYAQATGVSSEVVKAVMERLQILPNSAPPFYIRLTGSVVDNRVSGDILQLEIGRLTVPSNLISENKGAIISFLNDKITKIQGLSVKSATLTNGAVRFEGTLPAVEATVRQ